MNKKQSSLIEYFIKALVSALLIYLSVTTAVFAADAQKVSDIASSRSQISNSMAPSSAVNVPATAKMVQQQQQGSSLVAKKPIDSLQDTTPANKLFTPPSQQNREAFKALTSSTVPMSPEQVIRLHRMLNMMQKAVAASPLTPPVPVVTTRIVKLAPGVTPPVIRLGQGFVTSILFVDASGEPWPITSYDIGDAKSFNIQPPEKDGNMLMLQAMRPYTYGNMAITLKGMRTPVMLTLVPGQRVVDYRVDLHVNKIGPNGVKTEGSSVLPAAADDMLLNILNGISPHGAKLLTVSGCGPDNEAWLVNNKVYLRTKLTIVSPAWIAMMRSADGTRAYEMAQTPSVLVSNHGKLINLEIEGL